MADSKLVINMLSIKEKLYISVDSINGLTERLMKMFAEMQPSEDMTEEFILGSISGLEFFKDRIQENSDKFNVEYNLSELGLSDQVKKIDLKIKEP